MRVPYFGKLPENGDPYDTLAESPYEPLSNPKIPEALVGFRV